jgi:type IV pilus assembly protein PilB
MVILTGPTGSGKSTTLVAALYAVISPEVNVLTVEDPVEYVINGARQIKLGPKIGFEDAIRAILRHDPDIVMVGEIRDKITADIAIKLANTGHLTFSTLHTNDAPSAVTRLFKMGIEPFLIAYAINLIVAQRLIRRLCPKCKQPATHDVSREALSIGFTEEEIETTTFYEAVGCPSCIAGYKGRSAIHEALYFSRAIRKIIFESGEEINEELVRQTAISEGMLTLRASGRERIKEGVTSIAEVAAATMSD